MDCSDDGLLDTVSSRACGLLPCIFVVRLERIDNRYMLLDAHRLLFGVSDRKGLITLSISTLWTSIRFVPFFPLLVACGRIWTYVEYKDMTAFVY